MIPVIASGSNEDQHLRLFWSAMPDHHDEYSWLPIVLKLEVTGPTCLDQSIDGNGPYTW